ncbi:hypothetical protein [Candidatus Nitrosocosmicus hydrocola]|uniref:hypothetical protein n=1 Tax=Candidatus Nitrosocosmicus hydrocola TaxID=1826872 RepID=UPI0011E5C351|nr:hypothetical protein [Candidatus Nitrosocosmicus hydrocola]
MDVQVQDCEKYILKPDIRIGNYYFQWNANDGLGIDVREINHFKNFIRKIIPLLEQYMIFLQNKVDKNDPFQDKKQICIKEKYNKKISFLMFIDSQGSTVFFREESCNVDDVSKHEIDYGVESLKPSNINCSSNNNDSTIKVELKWILGELLFDRNKQDGLKKKN